MKGCVINNLECRDVPALTTPILKSLGFNEYKVKKMWKVAKLLTGFSLNIYRFEEAFFYVALELRREPLYVYRNVYVDFIDCQKKGCIEYPKGNKLYLYIEGSIEGSFIKINSVLLLKKLFETKPKCYNAIIDLVLNLWKKNPAAILRDIKCLFNVMNAYRDVVSIMLPKAPSNVKELLLVSPVIRASFPKKLFPST